MTTYPKYVALCVLLAISQVSLAQTPSECIGSLMAFQGRTLYVRPSLTIKTAGDAKREWSRLGVTGSCQALGVTEVLMKLQDNKINGVHMVFATGPEKLLPMLDAATQAAVIAQLTRDSDAVAMHPVSFFAGDGAGFNYAVAYKRKAFTETLSWGMTAWGVEDER